MVAEDACDVEAFYRQQPPPPAASEASILVIQADGKGVPMVRQPADSGKVRLSKGDQHNRKKEAVRDRRVHDCPTSAHACRRDRQPVSPDPQGGTRSAATPGTAEQAALATLAGKDAALGRLAKQAARREGPHIEHRVALTDGAEALQERVQKHRPDFSLVLDFIHADEYLWHAANSLFGETSAQRTPWVEQQTLGLLSGRHADVVSELRRLATLTDTKAPQRKVLDQVAHYFERNAPYMQYDQYLAQGCRSPPASSKVPVAIWSRTAASSRACAGPWRGRKPAPPASCRRERALEDYQRFHQEQRYQRLYGLTMPSQPRIDEQAFEPAAVPVLPHAATSRLFIMPVIVKPRTAASQPRSPDRSRTHFEHTRCKRRRLDAMPAPAAAAAAMPLMNTRRLIDIMTSFGGRRGKGKAIVNYST